MFVFDIEIYKNFFSCIFIDIESGKEYIFIKYKDRDDLSDLIVFLKLNPILIGFNSINFDNVLLNAIICDTDSTLDLFKLAQNIIEGHNKDIINKYRYMDGGYKSIDVMRMMAFDVLGMSLKQVCVNLRWDNVQDLPIPYGSLIKDEDVDTLISYNRNDVLSLKKLYLEVQPQLKLREEVAKVYGFDKYKMMSASDSKMGMLILNKLYSEQLGQPIYTFEKSQTERNEVRLSDCVSPHIQFKSDILQNFLNKVKKIVLSKDKDFRFNMNLEYGNLEFNFGVGGLHSKDQGGIFETKNGKTIIDADVASFYPYIILINNIKPAHVHNCWLDVFRNMTEERIQAKQTGDKAKADALKITINSVFGKLRSENYWLYDPRAFLSVTVNGELYLLMLIEKLFESAIEVISANTDGVICRVEDEEKYNRVTQEWAEQTGFKLEFTKYKRYIRRDVNSYIAEDFEGRIKEKGIFETEINLKKGYKYPFVSKALRGYFLEGKTVRECFEEANSIHDFFISQKIGRKFKPVFRYIEDGQLKEEQMQKTNRFFASLQGGEFVKVNDKKEIKVCSQSPVIILNRIEEGKNYLEQVSYHYYRHEVQKIIDKIEPKNLPQTPSLF